MMLARVAETLFEVSRQLERAETTARLLEVTHALGIEVGDRAQAERDWDLLVRVLCDHDTFMSAYRMPDETTVGWHLALSEDNPDAIAVLTARAREGARSVRDRLSSEVWEALNSLYLEFRRWDAARMQREGVYFLSRTVRQQVYLIQGLIETTLRHDDHWTFLRLGRSVERALQTARLASVYSGAAIVEERPDDMYYALHRWRALLQAAFADEVFARMHGAVTGESVLRFVVLDERLPRSLTYIVSAMERYQLSLIDDLSMIPDARPLRLTQAVGARLEEGAAALLSEPVEYLDDLRSEVEEIADAIGTTCFASAYRKREEPWSVQAQSQSQN